MINTSLKRIATWVRNCHDHPCADAFRQKELNRSNLDRSFGNSLILSVKQLLDCGKTTLLASSAPQNMRKGPNCSFWAELNMLIGPWLHFPDILPHFIYPSYELLPLFNFYHTVYQINKTSHVL